MPQPFRLGDLIAVVQVPPELHDAAAIGTPHLFERVLGKTLRVVGFSEYGHLELHVLDDGTQAPDNCHNTLWIEPEFVKHADDATPTIKSDGSSGQP